MEEYLLRVEDISLKRDGLDILYRVHLDVRPGEVHGLLGLNGSGKSSLAYTLMGCAGYPPDEGRIWFDGQDITHLPMTERAKLGLTLAWQEPARFEGLSRPRSGGAKMSFNKAGAVEQSVEEAVQALAVQLMVQPEVAALKRAAAQVDADPQAQRLMHEMWVAQRQLRHGWSHDEEVRLAQLSEQLETLPSIRAYRQAERPLRDLCRAVDVIISDAAGVAFAANAQRSCCGG